MRIRIGTRGSPLALIQTRMVTDAIACYHADTQADVLIVRTEGDRNLQDSLVVLGGRGVFVREIEERLLAGDFDLAVHSLKDLPTTQPEGLVLAAILARGDVRDALVSHGGQILADLPPGAVVGSSSQRRSAQVLALRPDLVVQSIRGNVETRLRKLDGGQYDAIVLAAAGLERMGLAGRITESFSMAQMLPAVGQGALAVECRADDTRTVALLAPLDDAQTRAAVSAERAFLRGLGGGCTLPIGAYAEVEGSRDDIGIARASGDPLPHAAARQRSSRQAGDDAGEWLTLHGLIAQPDGQRTVRGMLSGAVADAETIGVQLAERLLAEGGRTLMEALHAAASPA